MKRRIFAQTAIALTLASAMPHAIAFKGIGKKLGGKESSSSDISWKDLAKQFSEAKSGFAETATKQALISADIADALDLKSEAALLRGEAENLSAKGDALGSSDLDEISENSASTNALVEEKMREAETLSDAQKEALGKAAIEFVPTLVAGIGVAVKVKEAVESASGIGAPGIRDGRAAVSAAKDIPVLGPKMIKFLITSAKTGKSLMSLMNSKGVATPDASGMDAQLEAFV